jgi:uncharacterized Zn finger protein
MSRWNRWSPWERYTPTPKKPPPKRGIKLTKSGSTWWGKRWVEALERLSFGYSNRLARGRTYARAGRTHDLVVKGSKVTAKVTGSRSAPYNVTITLGRLSDGVWDKAIGAMAEKAQFSAELLAGQMPQEIDGAFQAAGASIFPGKEADLTTSCSCPDWANPCKHVAATHYVLGEAFDRDPFLLFELRGRSKAQLLDALRAARADDGDPSSRAHEGESAGKGPPVPTVTLGRIKAPDWDKPTGTLPSLRLSFETPPVAGGLLRQLGTPPGWSGKASPAEALGPLIRAAAVRARAMAMAEAETEQEAAPATASLAEPAEANGLAKSSRRTGTRTTGTARSLPKPVVRSTKAPTKRAAATKKTANKKAPPKKKTANKKAPPKKRTANKVTTERKAANKETTEKTPPKKKAATKKARELGESWRVAGRRKST